MRVDGNDYSIHPSVIGRRIEVGADLGRVWAGCDGLRVADHQRVWAKHQTVSDFEHLVAAKALQRGRADLLKPLPAAEAGTRIGADVQVRDLARYDTILGLDNDVHDGLDNDGHDDLDNDGHDDHDGLDNDGHDGLDDDLDIGVDTSPGSRDGAA